ncbi:uncharacterized protein [Halyomorpha halys]|uniref:uncharacterized protein isoform X1 n=1 Tax=Halyomorpha halys TaxID=286706 RepID=UPI0006D4FEE1|nr:uncharacterized protein LOC106679128 isoform X1 [Halyomorpha halys]
MLKILRNFVGTIKRIRTRTITADGTESDELRAKWVQTFISHNRNIIDDGIWNRVLRGNVFLTKPVGTEVSLLHNNQTVANVYWSFSFKDKINQLLKKKKGGDPKCATKKKKKIIKPKKCSKKKSKKKCSKTKPTCLDPSKKKKKDKAEAKKDDPCEELNEKAAKAKKNDPCKESGEKAAKAKKDDPCEELKEKAAKAKKDDPCKELKEKAAKEKKDDPCKESGKKAAKAKKDDPCEELKEKAAKAKKDDPCKGSGEKAAKAKKDDPCKEFMEKAAKAKKDDPCEELKEKAAKAKKDDPCKGSGEKAEKAKKDDPCKEFMEKAAKAKKDDPCKESGEKAAKAKKEDFCKALKEKLKKKAKGGDPCASKEDPCKDTNKKAKAKKEDPCKDIKEKVKAKGVVLCASKGDPCNDTKKMAMAKKVDPCARKEDPCKDSKKKAKAKKEDPCKEFKEKVKAKAKKEDPCKSTKEKAKAKGVDPCASKEDPCKDIKGKGSKKDDPCKNVKPRQPDPCAKSADPCKNVKPRKPDPCAKSADPCKNVKPRKPDPCAKNADPCKNVKPRKPDPCAMNADPCKNVKPRKPDPCAKNADPCKNVKPRKPDPCAKNADSKKDDPCKNVKMLKKDPCAKIAEGTIMEPFMLDFISSNVLRKEYPITTLLTASSAKSLRLIPSYSKLSVRGLKQSTHNSVIIRKSHGKQLRILNKYILKGNVKRTETNKNKKGLVSTSLSDILSKVIMRAKERLSNYIIHMSHYKKNITAKTFDLGKRLDFLRSLIGCDCDQYITSGKTNRGSRNGTEKEIMKQVLLTFGEQQNETNNSSSHTPHELPKPLKLTDSSFLLGPTTIQTLFKCLRIRKVKNGNDLSSEIVHFKDETTKDINHNPLPIMQKKCKTDYYYWKNYNKFHEINQSILHSRSPSFLNVHEKSCPISKIDNFKGKLEIECEIPKTPSCCDIDSRTLNYINLNDLNKVLLKISLNQGEKWLIGCSSLKLEISTDELHDGLKALCFKGAGSCEEFKHKYKNFTNFNEQSSDNLLFNDNFSNIERLFVLIENLGKPIYFCNISDLLVHWLSNIDNRCLQKDKIQDLQQFNSSSYADALAMKIQDTSIKSSGIQFFIDTEKCHRKKYGKKRKLPTCYDPDVESPIDEIWNRGEEFWPFFNECHKRIKDPNTYPPGSDPNANNMLFGNL